MKVANRGAIRSEHPPASTSAARADRAGGIDLDMAKLSGHPVAAADEMAVGEDAGSDALGNGHHDEIANSLVLSEPDFRQDAGVGGVLQSDLEVCGALDGSLEVASRPLEVGREDEALRFDIKAAGEADADS